MKTRIVLSAIFLTSMPVIWAEELVELKAMPQGELILPLPTATDNSLSPIPEPALTQKPPKIPSPKPTRLPQPTVTVAPEPPKLEASPAGMPALEKFLSPGLAAPPTSTGMSKIQNKNIPRPRLKPTDYLEPALIPPKIEIPTSPPPDSIFKRDKHGDDDWGPQPSCTRSPCN